MTDYLLRAAEPRDVPAVVGLITELAQFERLTHVLEVSTERLMPHLFGEQPVARCRVAELGPGSDAPGTVVGFALYFRNFSTFLAKPGLYLEDLYVQPAYRGAGIGRALLQDLAAQAVAEGCGRFEWSVLDWNAHAIGFYEAMGAAVLPDWRICRVTGLALERLAAAEPRQTA